MVEFLVTGVFLVGNLTKYGKGEGEMNRLLQFHLCVAKIQLIYHNWATLLADCCYKECLRES